MNTLPSTRPPDTRPITCPQCGSEEVTTHIAVDHFSYGEGPDAKQIEATVPVRTCRSCGLQFLDQLGETAKHNALCRALGLLTPSEIKAIRSAHCMSRLQFSRLTRIGVATLSRWERGITLPNPANDQFLRLLMNDQVFAVLARTETATDTSRASRIFRAIPDPTVFRSQQGAFQLRLAS